MKYDFLLTIHSNYVSVFHCFRDTKRCWSKSSDFNLPNCVIAPVGGDPIEISARSLAPENYSSAIYHRALFV